jgi:chaperonin GroES
MEQMNFKPIGDRVLVEPSQQEEKTAGGLFIPDTAKEKPTTGTVVAVGPGKKDEPMTLTPGDTVVFNKYSGTEFKFEGKNYLIMKESDIFATI